MEAALEISELAKRFGDITAVDSVSIKVYKGEMFGLVGPDGAGKTTTIRSVCGLINPDAGNIYVSGMDIRKSKKDIQNRIGYLSQKFSLYGDLSVDENIEFFADIHGVNDYKERRDELLAFTRLTSFRERQADKLSGGMKQKLALACSLIHKPEILFLDEPTTGVDPVSRRDFWKILSGLLKEGITIIMTTPYLDEAERCSRVALMNKGKIISADTPAALKASIKKQKLEIICSPVRKANTIMKEKGGFDGQLFGDRIDLVTAYPETDSTAIKDLLTGSGVEITGIKVTAPSLENVFIHLVSERR